MMVNKGGLQLTSCAVCKKLVCLLGVVIRVREKDSCVEGSDASGEQSERPEEHMPVTSRSFERLARQPSLHDSKPARFGRH
jgi:hypothetical protein